VAIVWDEKKQKLNIEKHGMPFAPALAVLDDPYALTTVDQEPERLVTSGADAEGRILVVDIRLISARRATGRERKR
jgi:uncharacterized DUF497 family protein